VVVGGPDPFVVEVVAQVDDPVREEGALAGGELEARLLVGCERHVQVRYVLV